MIVMNPGYPRLLEIADRFREMMEKPEPMDDHLAALMREFIHRVQNIAAVDDRNITIHLADRCGQIRAEIYWRYHVDPETDTRRDHLVNKGRAFRTKETGNATAAHMGSAESRAKRVIAIAKTFLLAGKARSPHGKINARALARECVDAKEPLECPVGFDRAYTIIRDAVKAKKLQ